MKNYTPGPWEFKVSETGLYITTVGAIFRKQNGIEIPAHTQRANAQLIAHAPEMLEMLEYILRSDVPVTNDRIESLIKRATTI